MNTKNITFAVGLVALLSGCASMEDGEFVRRMAVFGQTYSCHQGNQSVCPAAQRQQQQEAAPAISYLPVPPAPPITTYCYTRSGTTACQSR